jgi:iron complex transport system permease protein
VTTVASGSVASPPLHRSVRLIVLAALALGAALLSVMVGSRMVPPAAVWSYLTAYDPTLGHHIVLGGLRIPRTVAGILVGGALGTAGLVSQGVTRNPLGSPDILGINAGAALFVVLAISVLKLGSAIQFVWFAFAGALIASLLTFALAAIGGSRSPTRLALAGVITGGLCLAWTDIMMLMSQSTLEQARFWLVGALARPAYAGMEFIAILIGVGLVLAAASARALNLMAMGDDVAVSLGIRPLRARIVAMASVVLLAGSAVAICGPIGFVALVAPHLMRPLFGTDHRWLLPASGLAGIAILLVADVIGRVVVLPGELQAGIIMGVVGAPFLIVIARHAGSRR